MTLPEDTILENRYRIDRLIAHGGMGAIYQGFDIKLDIPVALKENFFQTPQGIRQFQQEARILARLHHPGLPRVIDHFDFEGQQYLVMDFIEGQDLWGMVKTQRQPLEEKQALDYMIQVCEAVKYLHRQNPPIIHRDIKPQNIKITPEGRAVLVDFGIAKVAANDSHTSTGARGLTPGFSPPEQYSGTGTNQTSDIYALGATLYAVLTGKKPPDSISRMAGGAKFEPPDTINPKLSRGVSEAIDQAMQVRQMNRPQSVAAWQQELETILKELTSPPPAGAEPIFAATVAATASAPAISEPTLASATPMVNAATSGVEHPLSGSAKGQPAWRWLGLGLVILTVIAGAIAVFANWRGNAPDDQATRITTVAPVASTSALPTHTSAPPTAVATPKPAVNPLDSETKTPQPTTTPGPTQTAKITLSPSPDSQLTAGNSPTPAARLEPLPIRIGFVSQRGGVDEIYWGDTNGSHIVKLATGVDPAWSPDGTKVAFGSSPGIISVIDTNGANLRELTNKGDWQPTWSPTGEQIAFLSTRGGLRQIYKMDSNGGNQIELTHNSFDNRHPAWSPDGQKIAFISNQSGRWQIWVINADGANPSMLTDRPFDHFRPVWSPDNQKIAFGVWTGERNEIWVMQADGANPTPLVTDAVYKQEFTGYGLTWAPSDWLAFVSDRDGNPEIYAIRVDGTNLTRLTADPAVDFNPIWVSNDR